MKAMRLHAVNEFILEEVEKPVPKEDEILIRVDACGICGSDIPRVYELGTKVYPVTLGHEYCGTIVEVGNEKDQELIGKKTAVYPVIPCGECPSCKIGQYAQCSNYGYLGSRNDGGFAQYCLLPSKWHLVMPDQQEIEIEDLALTEPATVALHAIRKGQIHGGDVVVILGAGPIGILMARWCQKFGAKPILVDIADPKVKFARERGFEVLNSMTQDCVKYIYDLTDGKMADVVIEGTGTGAGINQAIECCRTFGTIVMLGNPHRDTTIELNNHSSILRKELNLIGVWNNFYNELPLNEWKYTVDQIAEKQLEVADLITHKADLEHLKELFDKIYHKEISICKAIYSNKDAAKK